MESDSEVRSAPVAGQVDSGFRPILLNSYTKEFVHLACGSKAQPADLLYYCERWDAIS
ncbi:MAG: hypothetical protein ACLQVJ_30415 [Syntrophobacteraceae bacterium]